MVGYHIWYSREDYMWVTSTSNYHGDNKGRKIGSRGSGDKNLRNLVLGG